MSFKQDIPNYKSYSDEEYYMISIPSAVWSELSGLILRAASDTGLRCILYRFAEIIPCEPTQNWGYDYLKNDIRDFISLIKKKVEKGRIDVLMDCMAVLVEETPSFVDDINDFLYEHEIGYTCYFEPFLRKIEWSVREGLNIVDEIHTTKMMVKSTSQQAFEEFERAIVTLEDADDERARKDAVRSCASAMEAIIKAYGNNDEIGEATKILRSEKCWGLDDIVKDGNSIFNSLHRFYPDLRHDSTEISTMPIEEAEYWIGRMNTYIRYMKKMADKLGR